MGFKLSIDAMKNDKKMPARQEPVVQEKTQSSQAPQQAQSAPYYPQQGFIPNGATFGNQPQFQTPSPYMPSMPIQQAYAAYKSPVEQQPPADPREEERKRILSVLSASLAEIKKPFRVMMLGGDNEYYGNIFAFFHEANENIEFIEHLNGAGDKAYYDIEMMNPDLIIIHHASPIQSAVQFIQSLSKRVNSQNVLLRDVYKDKRVLVIAPEDVTYELLLTQNLGIRHYVKESSEDSSIDIEAFAVNIRNAYIDIENQKRSESIRREASGEEYFLQQKAKRITKVIGVYSATGGIGKTMFASNLAVVLGKYGNVNGNKSRVCLVEFTLGEKEMDLFLGVRPECNITDLARVVGPLLADAGENETKEQVIERKTKTFEAIRTHMTKDEADHIDILVGTDAQYDYDVLSENFVIELFTCIKQMYDIIIVDFPTDMCRRQIILGLANMEDIYYLCPMEVPAIRNAKILISLFTTQYGFRKESIKMIINKILPEELRAFSREEVAAHFAKEGVNIVGELPWEEKASISINRGEPLTRSLDLATFNLAEGASNYAEAVYDIATQINPMLAQPLAEADDRKAGKAQGTGKKGIFGKLTSAIFSKKEEKGDAPKKKVRKPVQKKAQTGNLLRGRK